MKNVAFYFFFMIKLNLRKREREEVRILNTVNISGFVACSSHDEEEENIILGLFLNEKFI